jgi:predicted exporter
VLRAAESVGQHLSELADAGMIGGFTSPATYLPSQATQEARRASLPPEQQLRERLGAALAGLPVAASRLEPFLGDVERARTGPLITAKDLSGTSLGAATQAMLFAADGSWHALLPLKLLERPESGRSQPAAAGSAPIDVARVSQALAHDPGLPMVLGVKAESNRLYATYLREAVSYSLAGAAAIVVLLCIALRSLSRVARVVVPLILSVLCVTAGLALTGHPLGILHVIGLLLIVAVGSNYALFFDRRASEAGEGSLPLTLASLMVANLATVLTFGVLAFSSVPVLSALGTTVAPGTLLALLFSAVLARPLAEAPRAQPAL